MAAKPLVVAIGLAIAAIALSACEMMKIIETDTDDIPRLVASGGGLDQYLVDVELGRTPADDRPAYFQALADRTCGYGNVRGLKVATIRFQPADCRMWDVPGVTCQQRAWTTYRVTFACPSRG
jgi:hypothetical protein